MTTKNIRTTCTACLGAFLILGSLALTGCDESPQTSVTADSQGVSATVTAGGTSTAYRQNYNGSSTVSGTLTTRDASYTLTHDSNGKTTASVTVTNIGSWVNSIVDGITSMFGGN